MKNALIKIFFVVALIACTTISSFPITNPIFRQKNNYYEVKFSIPTKCSKDKIISVVYDILHVKKYIGDYKLKLLKTTDSSYVYTLIYKYFIYKSYSTYIKKKLADGKTITFKLVKYKHNLGILPKVISSHGYYKIIEKPELNQRNLVYYQKVILSRKIGSFYESFARKKTKEFYVSLKKYLKNI